MSLLGIIALVADAVVYLAAQRGFPGLPLFIFEVLLNAFLYLYYYRNVFRNSRVPAEQRNLWSIVTFMTGPVGQLVYYYRYVKA